MKKYFISKDKDSFHIFYKGATELEKEKYRNDLKENYGIETSSELYKDVSLELLLNKKNSNKN